MAGVVSYRLPSRVINSRSSSTDTGTDVSMVPGLFQPGAFEREEWGDAVAAVGLALQSVVSVAFVRC